MNAIGDWFTGEKFHESDFYDNQIDPTVEITQEEFEDTKNKLEQAINRKLAGLDDIMLKKMILAYNRGIYLKDTLIIMELADGEDNKEEMKPFDIIKGDEDKGIGKNGKKYISTNGMISITKGGEQLLYYPEDALTQIYIQGYRDAEYKKEEAYDDAKAYLKRCYTFGDNGIKMYCFNEHKKETTLKHINGDIEKRISRESNTYADLVNIEYYSKISQYATPIEFMVDLMELTGSKEFINSFLEMVGTENYVNLKIKGTKVTDTTKTTTKRIRQINVEGQKINSIRYKVMDDNGNSLQQVVSSSEIDSNKINIKVKEIEDKKVALYTTGDKIREDDNGNIIYEPVEKDKDGNAIYRELNKNNNYTTEWENLDKSNTENKIKTDTSEVIETTIETTQEGKYDIVVDELSNWYATIKQDNSERETYQYYTINADKKEIEIDNPNNVEEISLNDESYSYEKSSNIDLFETNNIMMFDPEREVINEQFSYVVKKPEEDYNYNDYDFSKMDFKDTNISSTTVKEIKKETYHHGTQKMTDNTDSFLALLSNATGKFDLSESFMPKSSGGKVVRYDDLYNSTTGVGELLENGAEVFFTLLEESENTQGLVDIMRYVVWRYSGINYGITNFEQFSNMLNPNWSQFGSQVLSGDTVEERVWYTLIANGYSEIATAGIMGNIYGESGFKPTATEAGNGEGYGLCQWSFGRKQQLIQYAESKGKEWNDVEIQIEFLLAELNVNGGCDGYANYQMAGEHYGYTYESWYNATDVETATKAFMAVFERPNMNLAHTDKRVDAAKKYYNEYQGKARNGGDYIEIRTAGIVGRFTSSITGRTFTMYNQNAPEIDLPGQCNRAVAASIASGYKKGTEMEVIADVKRAEDYVLSIQPGTSDFFSNYGLNVEVNHYAYSMENIRQIVSRGGYVAIWFQNGPVYGKSGGQYASTIHWIAILGYRNGENGEEIFISDPGWTNNVGWKKIDEFENCKSHIGYFTTIHE